MVSDISTIIMAVKLLSLNPCSNGIWSLTIVALLSGMTDEVLILVLMEYGL